MELFKWEVTYLVLEAVHTQHVREDIAVQSGCVDAGVYLRYMRTPHTS